MSASTEKKLRAQAIEEGTHKKTNKAAEEAKKRAKTKKKYTAAVIAALIFIVLTLVLNSNVLYRQATALKVGNDNYSPAQVNAELSTQYYNFTNTYGDLVSYFLDTSGGIHGLNSQDCAMMEEGGTWRDYFLEEMTIPALKKMTALCAYAEENGIMLEQSEVDSIDSTMAMNELYANAYGYPSVDKFLAYMYGKGVNADVARVMSLREQMSSKVIEVMIDEAKAADTEFVDYNMINVRHILVMAEADENGEITEEAKAAAKAKAEEILEKFNSGDKTEDSFAALATEFTDDTGSADNGGLYTQVYKGKMNKAFNDWCFDPARKTGDTGIVFVEEEGYYTGYHVMYFSGLGDLYSTSSAIDNDYLPEVNERITEMAEAVPVSHTVFCRLVGKS